MELMSAQMLQLMGGISALNQSYNHLASTVTAVQTSLAAVAMNVSEIQGALAGPHHHSDVPMPRHRSDAFTPYRRNVVCDYV